MVVPDSCEGPIVVVVSARKEPGPQGFRFQNVGIVSGVVFTLFIKPIGVIELQFGDNIECIGDCGGRRAVNEHGQRAVLKPLFDERFNGNAQLHGVVDVDESVVAGEGLVGEGHDLTPDALDAMRENTVALHLTKRLAEAYFRDGDEPPAYHLYNKLQPITRRWIRDCLVLKGGTKTGMLTYAELAERAAALIYKAIVREAGKDGPPVVRAMLDPYNPAGSTEHVSFITAKTSLWTTDPEKSPINYVVCDSDWEAEFARVVEAHPATLSYVKNQALGFEVPYFDGVQTRRYLPDFIVRLDDGRGMDDPLHLVVETKGFRGLDAQFKAETMRALFVPGVNRLGSFGRWGFVELRDAFEIEAAYGDAVTVAIAEARREREEVGA